MKSWFLSRFFLVVGSAGIVAPHMLAQNSIQLFSPVDVRLSQSGAGYGANEVIFNTNTLNLSCPATPKAVLSSAANKNRRVLVDNNIDVTNITTNIGPINVCNGGIDTSSVGPFESCFNVIYQVPAGLGLFDGFDPDSIAPVGGVPAIDISSYLIAGAQQVKIDLVDEGGYVAGSSLYLNTNCTSSGVTGPATISGNTIPPSNPPTVDLDQDFSFNPSTNQVVGFEYDLSGAETAGTLTINPNGVTPQVSDSGLEPLVAYPNLVSGTSFASSSCLVHNGELLNGTPACKVFTLTCTTGTGNSASGAQCPISTVSNEVLKDTFDGPAFTLPDFTPTGGPTFHEGMGFLMASEGWSGGPCTFDPASGLQQQLCPQNLLTSFTGPGTFVGSGQTTHPNSDFISIAQVPEDLTTPTITNHLGLPVALGPGNWTNNPSPYFTLSSLPPRLTGTGLPGAANFVAAPIKTVTYGLTPGTTPPAPGTTSASDTVLTNPISCPAPTNPGLPAAAPFVSTVQSLPNLNDGNYLLHYYATDCAGTEELKFVQDPSTLAWSTNFYTFPVNVDTVAPAVSSGPTLSQPGPYYYGQTLTASYACTDDRSGVVSCGSHTYGTGTLSTGTLSSPVPASVGPHIFTVAAVDAAGNQSSQLVNYTVSPAPVTIQITPVSPHISGGSLTFTAALQSTTAGTPTTGSVTFTCLGHVIGVVPVDSTGKASITLSSAGVSNGSYPLTAVYTGGTNYGTVSGTDVITLAR